MKGKLLEFLENVGMFFWMLIPTTPMLAMYAFMALEFSNVWFWVLCVVSLVFILIIHPHINSCSQWENAYMFSIISTVVVMILRFCGVFPLVA